MAGRARLKMPLSTGNPVLDLGHSRLGSVSKAGVNLDVALLDRVASVAPNRYIYFLIS